MNIVKQSVVSLLYHQGCAKVLVTIHLFHCTLGAIKK